MSFQTWVAMGNLTGDPEMKYVGETPKTTFSIAINERRGEKEEVIFVDVECWDKLAETVAEYKRKGDAVLVQGRWKMDTWEDREGGGKRKKWYVRADQVRFIGSRDHEDEEEERPRRRSSSRDDDRPRRSSRRDEEPRRSSRRDEPRDPREYDDLPF